MAMETSPPQSPARTPGRAARPRLFIKEMVLRNFKSYAGEQRIGPFHKSFSAVVGPNGSGKSNVIDAMLFVFGKRAKQMRLNKVSELIHNSSNHQNLDSAGVSVHFQEIIDLDDGNYRAVEGSDFVISRVAFRDNTSKYYINERGSNFTEVTKLLKGKGVDLDNNRFLILQGEVEQISLMKPKAQGPHDEGFLEYLEDIIGTNQYVEKIEEAYKQLEVLNEKRTASVQMLKLAEKERDSLESAKNEAETYMLKELSLLKWQEKATKLASDDATSRVAQLHENVADLENNLASEREKIQQNSLTLKEMESIYNKHVKRQEELENNMKACKDQFKEFERKDVKYREDLKHLKQKIKKLEDKAEKDMSKIDLSTKEMEESSNLIPELEGKIPKLQELFNEEEKVLERIKETSREETERLRAELTQVRTELEPWENQIIEHKGRLDVASAEKELMQQKRDGARAELTDAQNQMESIKEKIKTKESYIVELQEKIEKHQSEASEAHKVEHECLKQEELLTPLEQAARQKVTEIKSTRDSEKNQNAALKAILQAKESNQIQGIYGRLGDLGAIDEKYDVAISTACSGLKYIVVETTNSAQACIELLRRRNLGETVTCLILDKQTHLLHRVKEKVKTPEGVPRLFDLVKVKDEKLKLAFVHALGNTVVANDLDQASRIAYSAAKEFRRVVTLDGELFEASGTMSGGGKKAQRGMMGTSIRESVSEEAIKNAENDLNKLVEELNMLREKMNDAKRNYRSLEEVKSRLEMELAKAKKEVESMNAQYSYNEKRLDSLKAASKPKGDEVCRMEELDGIISTEQVELNRLTKCSSKLKDEASELQQKIENAGGQVLKDQKIKVANIQSELDKTSSEINRHKVKITSCEKLVKKLTKVIEESEKEKKEFLAKKEKMMSIFKEIEKKAFVVQDEYKKTQEMMDNHKDELDKTKEEYNKLKKAMDELRASEVDAEYKFQDTKKLAKEWEMKVKAFRKRLDNIQTDLVKHMNQIQKDAIDPEKLKVTLGDDELNDTCDLKRAVEMVALLEAQLKDLSPNLDSIAEYRTKARLYNERVDELNATTQERDDLKKLYDGLRKRRLDEFMAGFNIISLKLKEMYQMITLGGDAELELVDSLDPFSEGVVFSVRPPKKSWKNIANLSGGEKTLSSLALVFALHHYKPTPLYVMDEIDAALDFKNVSIVGHYVKDRTKDAQFIIISLRNNMFELADRLVGIYKTDNCTKSITINPGSFAEGMKAV
ncbi:structural maintenance of chromosomes protein 4 [Phragmites australis]|uniref:structural maintenance of chromosomes protein 4 n=1 Tax=Phragmites australis TaxID=29695 RepID=UPI002D76E554|nr:structural maintenance of chromosomes protein 4 [Phragmites australis]